MIDRLVIFGGTGDLTGRYLFPGLAALRAAGHLSARFELAGAGREDWNDEHFRSWAAGWLEREAPGLDAGAKATLIASSRYHQLDFADPANVAACVAGEGRVAVYLALPPAVFPVAISALRRAGLPPDSQVVLEKPFGEDLQSALELNRLLADLVDERHVFRVDHFLAMTTVQNVLGARLANRVLEAIWNSAHIEQVEIVWDESLALEGRAGYYDGVGALKDMVQNHLMQVLCLVAMEPPVSLSEKNLRDRKVDVLRSVRPLHDDAVAARTRRARYRAGRVGGRDIPAYVQEDGVTPARRTETFAEVTLELDSWRWSGTRFVLRTGKAMGKDRKEVVVRYRPVPHLPFEDSPRPFANPSHSPFDASSRPSDPSHRPFDASPRPSANPSDLPFDASPRALANRLRFGLEPEALTLELTGTGPGAAPSLVPLTLRAEMDPSDLPAYGRILLDVLCGNSALSIRADEAEEAWRVLTPVLDGWSRDLVPLEEYDAGSSGPLPNEYDAGSRGSP